MTTAWKWLAIIFLVLLVLAGSVLGYFLDKKSGELENAKLSLTTSQTDLKSTQAVLLATQNDLKQSKSNLDSTLNNLKSVQSTLNTLSANLTASQEKLTATQAELDTIKTQLTSANDRLNALNKLHPLKQFSDYSTLNTWVSKQPNRVGDFPGYLAEQISAMNEGLLISACYRSDGSKYYASMAAVLQNGDIYIWPCNTHQLLYVTNLNKL
jgi:septal ring factor EnvC (AmiA/AmiB activator)